MPKDEQASFDWCVELVAACMMKFDWLSWTLMKEWWIEVGWRAGETRRVISVTVTDHASSTCTHTHTQSYRRITARRSDLQLMLNPPDSLASFHFTDSILAVLHYNLYSISCIYIPICSKDKRIYFWKYMKVQIHPRSLKLFEAQFQD